MHSLTFEFHSSYWIIKRANKAGQTLSGSLFIVLEIPDGFWGRTLSATYTSRRAEELELGCS